MSAGAAAHVQFRLGAADAQTLGEYVACGQDTPASLGLCARKLLGAYQDLASNGRRQLTGICHRHEITKDELHGLMWALRGADSFEDHGGWQRVPDDVRIMQNHEGRLDSDRAVLIANELRARPLVSLALWDLALRYWALAPKERVEPWAVLGQDLGARRP